MTFTLSTRARSWSVHQPIALFEYQSISAEALQRLSGLPFSVLADRVQALNQAAGQELLRVGYRQLQATQFVGLIRLGGLSLQVLPKIDRDGDPDAARGSDPFDQATASATRNLLAMLAYGQDVAVTRPETAALGHQRLDWFELLTRLFAMELHRQVQSGVDRAYVSVEDTLPVLRGRWQIGRQWVNRPHDRARFDVVYDDFIADTSLNRIFRAAVTRLLPRSADPLNRRLLSDLDRWLCDVGPLPTVTSEVLRRQSFTRLNERFRPAFNLARLFLGQSVFQFMPGADDVFAFMFDMNLLFQWFVGRFLQRKRAAVFADLREAPIVRHQANGRALHLATHDGSGQPTMDLRPDLLIEDPTGRLLIAADTKYKRLQTARSGGGGPTSDDAYQMLAYGVGMRCRDLLLIYPQALRGVAVLERYRFAGDVGRLTTATIDLHQPLDRPDNLVQRFREIFHATIQSEA